MVNLLILMQVAAEIFQPAAPAADAPQQASSPYDYPPPEVSWASPRPPPAPPRPDSTSAKPERDVRSFIRLTTGAGTRGFSGQNDALEVEGYDGAKIWFGLDGGYFLRPNIGVGAWAALSLWSTQPYSAVPRLNEVAYFAGAQVPLKLGTRSIAAVFSPRLGVCAGVLSLGGEAPYQIAPVFGGEVSLTSFKYHIGGAIGWLRASAPPTGQLGRDHDFGGVYFVLGGSIDG